MQCMIACILCITLCWAVAYGYRIKSVQLFKYERVHACITVLCFKVLLLNLSSSTEGNTTQEGPHDKKRTKKHKHDGDGDKKKRKKEKKKEKDRKKKVSLVIQMICKNLPVCCSNMILGKNVISFVTFQLIVTPKKSNLK